MCVGHKISDIQCRAFFKAAIRLDAEVLIGESVVLGLGVRLGPKGEDCPGALSVGFRLNIIVRILLFSAFAGWPGTECLGKTLLLCRRFPGLAPRQRTSSCWVIGTGRRKRTGMRAGSNWTWPTTTCELNRFEMTDDGNLVPSQTPPPIKRHPRSNVQCTTGTIVFPVGLLPDSDTRFCEGLLVKHPPIIQEYALTTRIRESSAP